MSKPKPVTAKTEDRLAEPRKQGSRRVTLLRRAQPAAAAPEAAALAAEAAPAVRKEMAGSIDLPTFRQLPTTLTRADRLRLIEQALVLLEQNYVHLPLKKSMHAVEPVQRLRLLEHQHRHAPDGLLPGDLDFHREMIDIFMSVRDLHTNYILPDPYNGMTAYLPFLVEEFCEGGRRRYLVTRLVRGYQAPPFDVGVELTSFNGIPMERAVWLNGNRYAGSNEEARRARGIETLTVRPLLLCMPPDEDWVVVGYSTPDGQACEVRMNWLVFAGGRKEPFEEKASVAVAAAMGVDVELDAARHAKMILFAPEVVEVEQQLAARAAAAEPLPDTLQSAWPSLMEARVVDTPSGEFGYVRIRSFMTEDADAFVAEFVRLVEQLPETGLILDVRGNGGGLIWAGEQLLQTLTPRTIEPERSEFVTTALNYRLCQRHATTSELALAPWLESMQEAIRTGAVYSQAFPITPAEKANAMGQRYHGPVLLITDALCYSTTDIFAAGFQDHQIGPILGIHSTTGAGGANVWEHSLLKLLFEMPTPDPQSPYASLPRGSRMRVAIRRTLRVGSRLGMPVEDLGVLSNEQHAMTRKDLLEDNVDLINHAAQILANMPPRSFSCDILAHDEEETTLALTTQGMDRLDIYVDGRPQASLDIVDGRNDLTVQTQGAKLVELKGYRGQDPIAALRVPLPNRQ